MDGGVFYFLTSSKSRSIVADHLKYDETSSKRCFNVADQINTRFVACKSKPFWGFFGVIYPAELLL